MVSTSKKKKKRQLRSVAAQRETSRHYFVVSVVLSAPCGPITTWARSRGFQCPGNNLVVCVAAALLYTYQAPTDELLHEARVTSESKAAPRRPYGVVQVRPVHAFRESDIAKYVELVQQESRRFSALFNHTTCETPHRAHCKKEKKKRGKR